MPVNYAFTPFAIPSFIAAILSMTLALYGWLRRPARGAGWFAGLMLCVGWWALAYGVEVLSTDAYGKWFWSAMEYFGSHPTPVFWLGLALVYSKRETWLNRFNTALLFLPAAAFITLAWTNGVHELIWVDLGVETGGLFPRMAFRRGTIYWVSVIYDYVIFIAGLSLLVMAYLRAQKVYQRQIVVLIAAGLVPFAGNIVYLLNFVPTDVEITPLLFTVAGILLAWGMFRFRILDITPVARDYVVENMADAVIVLDDKRRVLDINPAASEGLGVNRETVLGYPAEDVLTGLQSVLQRFDGTEDTITEINLLVNDERCCYDVSYGPLALPSGRRMGQLIVMRDITERMQNQQVMETSNRRLRILHKLDRDLSRKVTVDFVLNMAADAAMRLSLADTLMIALVEEQGLRIIHALGNYAEQMENRLYPLENNITARVLRTREAELVLDVAQDPEYIPTVPGMQAQMSFPLISGEVILGVLTLETARPERFSEESFETMRLLTARIAVALDNAFMTEQREKLISELDAYAHTVAHDLKTPLSLVRGYSELLSDDLSKFEETDVSFIRKITVGAEKMQSIINELLLLASVRKGVAVEYTALDMGEIVQEALGRLDGVIAEHSAKICLADSWPKAGGYGPWVEEVWVNYVSNAIKYGGEPPGLDLGADFPTDGKVRFWVKDNGKGLTQAEQEQLFIEFSRVGDISKAQGHGLGLSVVKRIVERLGGEVGVESVIDSGSTFWFTLPVSEQH